MNTTAPTSPRSARAPAVLRTSCLRAWLLACLSIGALGGCGGSGQDGKAADSETGKLLIIGVDSADWRLWQPMLEEGRLPVLRGFMAQAARGRMKTFYPLEKSPLLWASICTGVKPEVHGVNSFVEGTDQKPVIDSAWYAPALWDILGAAGKTTAVVGMWTTYPARPIAGVMVSDYLPYGRGRERPLADLVFPDSLTGTVTGLRVDPDSLTAADLARFLPPDRLQEAERDFPTQVQQLRAALAADLGYVAVSEHLARTGDFDLFFFYLRGPDMISHHFYHYLQAEPGDPRVNATEIELFAQVVPRYYDWVDEVMGRVLGWFPDGRQVVVMSDHGFYGKRPTGVKGTQEHSEWGVFLVRSPLFQAGADFGHLELLDICPTVLALTGLPAAKDMPGTILTAGTTPAGAKRLAAMQDHRVESYLALRPAVGPQGERDPGVDEEIRRQLRSLGYIN